MLAGCRPPDPAQGVWGVAAPRIVYYGGAGGSPPREKLKYICSSLGLIDTKIRLFRVPGKCPALDTLLPPVTLITSDLFPDGSQYAAILA